MKNTIICTVGTSLINNMKRQNINKNDDIVRKLLSLNENDNLCGAEINSNYSIINNGYIGDLKRLYFCISDTDDGKRTGEILKSYYEKKYSKVNVEIKVIDKLQSEQYKDFKNHGLKNLVKIISDIILKLQEDIFEPVINSTGGYKAQISFAGLIGQSLKIPVYYQFERFIEVIEMPPMPVSFDNSLWNEYFDILDSLYRKDLIGTNEIEYKNLDDRIRLLIDEDEDSKSYILSPVGLLFHLSFIHKVYKFPKKPEEANKNKRTGVNIVKDHHKPNNLESYLNRIYNDNNYIKKIVTYALGNQDSYFKKSTKIAPENNYGEYCIEGCYRNKELSSIFDIYTTAKTEEEVSYVLNELSENYLKQKKK